jgi:ferrous iron transport protein B
LVAKENVIGTFGILYGHLGSVSDNGKEVWSLLHADFTPVAAYSFLVFNLLCAPCFAAIGAIRREMGTVKWTLTAIGYQCGLAYLVSFVTYQLGHVLFEGGSLGFQTFLSLIVLAYLIYQIVRKPKQTIIELTNVVPSMKEG